jgi:hypothetical protein
VDPFFLYHQEELQARLALFILEMGGKRLEQSGLDSYLRTCVCPTFLRVLEQFQAEPEVWIDLSKQLESVVASIPPEALPSTKS